eukprot:TRINITY_DN1392_c0_g4_i1.p1 TRINITY_DN1392_c0_g4~~TRINITY_DN1392_c0_g4_i1.p1  ORF type:complete len:447 (-),score=173.10 TRINITY_DN1392_c0_g4_i1:1004-2344(-)
MRSVRLNNQNQKSAFKATQPIDFFCRPKLIRRLVNQSSLFQSQSQNAKEETRLVLTNLVRHFHSTNVALTQSTSQDSGKNNNNTNTNATAPVPNNPSQQLFILTFLFSIIGGGAFLFYYLQTQQEERAKRRAKRKEDELEELLLYTFNAFASLAGKDGQKLMNEADFLASLQVMFGADALTLSQEKLKALLRMAEMDTAQGTIDYQKFKLFAHNLNQPDAEYKILFYLFDKSGDHRISKAEFIQVLKAANEGRDLPFNFDSDFMSLFFGKNGTKLLSYTAFTQLLKMLQEERNKQMFFHRDTEGRGYITEQQFMGIIESFERKKIPKPLKERLPVVSQLGSRTNFVTYAQFAAVDSILESINSYERVLKDADRKFPNTPISQELFMSIAKSATSIEITPMELMISLPSLTPTMMEESPFLISKKGWTECRWRKQKFHWPKEQRKVL